VAYVGSTQITVGDFTHLPTRCKFLAIMPQWDFLDFIAEEAKKYATFRLLLQHEVTDILLDGGRVVGVKAKTSQGELEVRADLVVACDGRSSTVREKSGFEVLSLGAPMDVLWMRISRKPDDPPDTMGRVNQGHILVMINRNDYWQCGFVVAKGSSDDIRREGLPALGEKIVGLAPFLRDRVGELRDWKQVSQLTVRVDRLKKWFADGLLCIGDAAHAMSPVGGVGINLAVADAIAAANILAGPLSKGRASLGDLEKVQSRRMWPTRVIQRVQVTVQNRVIQRVLSEDREMTPPLSVRMLNYFPVLQRLPARLVGLGVRPERVRTRATGPARPNE
jgi:2-polyprenyl-6-methoxyphenol hydroxylase-like FAD-dependent oxidoreductase